MREERERESESDEHTLLLYRERERERERESKTVNGVTYKWLTNGGAWREKRFPVFAVLDSRGDHLSSNLSRWIC